MADLLTSMGNLAGLLRNLCVDHSVVRFHAPLVECRIEAWYDAHPEHVDHEVAVMLTGETTYRRSELVAVGDEDHCQVSHAKLVKVARKLGCSKVILAHNHVGGPMRPSIGDARAMEAAADAMRKDGIMLALTAVYSEGEGCFCWIPSEGRKS